MMKYGCLIIMVPSALAVTGGIIWDTVFGNSIGTLLAMLIVIASMVYLFVNQFNYGGNMVSYVLCDGGFVPDFYPERGGRSGSGRKRFSRIRRCPEADRDGRESRQQSQELLNRNSFLHTQLNKNNCWKIMEVKKNHEEERALHHKNV